MNHEGFHFLFVTADEFPPFRPDTEVLFGKELLNRGYTIEWIMRAGNPDQLAGRIDWRGCTVYLARTNSGISRLDRLRKHISAIRNDLRVLSLVRRNRYDFIQVKDKFLAGVMAIFAARRHGIKCFFWLSFPFPEQSLALAQSPGARYRLFYLFRGWAFRFLLYKIICPKADHIFVQSEEMKKAMSERGVSPAKMTPVPMGVDMDAVNDESRSSRNDAKTQDLLYLGALDRARHLEFLLQVLASIISKHPNVRLYFVGDSAEVGARKFLEDEAKRLGVEGHVVFTGFLSREAALNYVRAASVCIALTPADSVYGVASSTKLIEYMAIGRPVVANTHPDQQLVIEESGAGRCVPWETEEFAEGISWLLEHPKEAFAMGMRGREYVSRRRSYKMIASDLDAQYVRLMSNSG